MELLYQRDIYGQTLVELGRQNRNIVVFDADLSGSTRTKFFAKEYPERFFNFGVGEQNMLAASAGMASCGKIVFVSTFAMFATGRVWDQIRNTICYSDFDVKIVASHAGITVGEDGSSHQALEDIALMRLIPNMKVIVPCDGDQTRDAVLAAVKCPGPFYIRMGRAKIATISGKPPFEFGKIQVLKKGKDLVFFACGIMVSAAIEASEALSKKGINAAVVNVHTLRPLDKEAIIRIASATKGVVVCEEHSIIGGLASAISETLNERYPVRIKRIGIRERFGQSGSPKALLAEYGLTAKDIEKAANSLLA